MFKMDLSFALSCNATTSVQGDKKCSILYCNWSDISLVNILNLFGKVKKKKKDKDHE